MKTIYMFGGHNINSKGIGTGAFYQENKKVVWEKNTEGKLVPKYDEAVLAREFVSNVAKILYTDYNINTITDRDDWSYIDTIKFAASRAKKYELVIDVHFNAAANPKAGGTEVIVPNSFLDAKDSENELLLATNIASVFSEVLEINKRTGKLTNYPGVKKSNESQHNSIGILDKLIWGTNLLFEICFISNPDEMLKYTVRKERLFKEVAKTIADYVNK